MLAFDEDDPTAPKVSLDDLLAFDEDDPTAPKVSLDDLLALDEDDPTAPKVSLDDLLALDEDDPTAPKVSLDDLLALDEDDPTAPKVSLDDLITYYTIRHKLYHQSSDEATLSLLVKTRLMQQALYELDIAAATASFIRFHKLSDTMLMSPKEER